MPRVNIGLPVFNGENYLDEALDSILAQTYADFELIISDNASSDRTEDICRAYAARDDRIHYCRNDKNLGLPTNFNRVFEMCAAEYFTWAAHDDIIAPDFLTRCIDVLDRDPSVVLCYPKTRIINEHGIVVQNYDVKLKTDSRKPQERFHDLVCVSHRCFQLFGVARRSILKKTALIANYAGSDRVLLARLALFGRFHEVPEYLFFRRNHPEQGSALRTLHAQAVWLDPEKIGQIIFPEWRLLVEFCLSVRGAPLSRYERTCCYLHIGRRYRKRWKRLTRELMVAVRQMRAGLPKPDGQVISSTSGNKGFLNRRR